MYIRKNYYPLFMDVMLLDDDDFTRQTIKNALVQNKINVVCAAATVKSAIDCANKVNIDVTVIDYNLGRGPNGIDAAQALAKIQPNMGFVLLTGFLDPNVVLTSMTALPVGSRYLLKQNLQDINQVIHEIKSASSTVAI